VDVGAAAQIRGEILALRDAGLRRAGGQRRAGRTVRISDRLHVIAKGGLSPVGTDRAEATVEQIGEWMSGLWHEEVQAHLANMAAGRRPCSSLKPAPAVAFWSYGSPLLALASPW
jgi:hypothetical protein